MNIKIMKYSGGSLHALRSVFNENLWCAICYSLCGNRYSLFICGIRYSFAEFKVFYRIPHNERRNA